ncbi:hypothetical protein BN1708_004268 [Verticillium longisporum]|uniref:Uncharacterized protein n=1 Tax=Verticillium longisporum TaxID=100787 RepID=A0A0G4LYC4_VERLO|nr:hypothetical protein BN1708_004268 [Verticillium longisporum]
MLGGRRPTSELGSVKVDVELEVNLADDVVVADGAVDHGQALLLRLARILQRLGNVRQHLGLLLDGRHLGRAAGRRAVAARRAVLGLLVVLVHKLGLGADAPREVNVRRLAALNGRLLLARLVLLLELRLADVGRVLPPPLAVDVGEPVLLRRVRRRRLGRVERRAEREPVAQQVVQLLLQLRDPPLKVDVELEVNLADDVVVADGAVDHGQALLLRLARILQRLGNVRQHLGLLLDGRHLGRAAGRRAVAARRAVLGLLVVLVHKLGLGADASREVNVGQLAALNGRLLLARLVLLFELRLADVGRVLASPFAVDVGEPVLLRRVRRRRLGRVERRAEREPVAQQVVQLLLQLRDPPRVPGRRRLLNLPPQTVAPLGVKLFPQLVLARHLFVNLGAREAAFDKLVDVVNLVEEHLRLRERHAVHLQRRHVAVEFALCCLSVEGSEMDLRVEAVLSKAAASDTDALEITDRGRRQLSGRRVPVLGEGATAAAVVRVARTRSRRGVSAVTVRRVATRTAVLLTGAGAVVLLGAGAAERVDGGARLARFGALAGRLAGVLVVEVGGIGRPLLDLVLLLLVLLLGHELPQHAVLLLAFNLGLAVGEQRLALDLAHAHNMLLLRGAAEHAVYRVLVFVVWVG